MAKPTTKKPPATTAAIEVKPASSDDAVVGPKKVSRAPKAVVAPTSDGAQVTVAAFKLLGEMFRAVAKPTTDRVIVGMFISGTLIFVGMLPQKDRLASIPGLLYGLGALFSSSPFVWTGWLLAAVELAALLILGQIHMQRTGTLAKRTLPDNATSSRDPEIHDKVSSLLADKEEK